MQPMFQVRAFRCEVCAAGALSEFGSRLSAYYCTMAAVQNARDA
jgi:hypothetical protein